MSTQIKSKGTKINPTSLVQEWLEWPWYLKINFYNKQKG